MGCIDKDGGFISGVSGIDKVVWIIEAGYIYFALIMLKCGFG